jgi:hypothetical protein
MRHAIWCLVIRVRWPCRCWSRLFPLTLCATAYDCLRPIVRLRVDSISINKLLGESLVVLGLTLDFDL